MVSVNPMFRNPKFKDIILKCLFTQMATFALRNVNKLAYFMRGKQKETIERGAQPI